MLIQSTDNFATLDQQVYFGDATGLARLSIENVEITMILDAAFLMCAGTMVEALKAHGC